MAANDRRRRSILVQWTFAAAAGSLQYRGKRAGSRMNLP
jgi:hypothetical protein